MFLLSVLSEQQLRKAPRLATKRPSVQLKGVISQTDCRICVQAAKFALGIGSSRMNRDPCIEIILVSKLGVRFF